LKLWEKARGKYEPFSRTMVFDAGAGMVLGFFAWLGYRTLSFIDPFAWTGVDGLVIFSLLGGLLYRTRARAIVWAVPAAIAFLIAVVAFTPIVVSPARALIRTDSMQVVDAVVVLSSGLSDDQVLDQEGVDRLLTGLGIARRIGARAIVLTPLSVEGSEGMLSSKYDQLRLYYLARAPVQLIITDKVGNTHDEALQTRKVASERRWKRVALVTSPLHSRRACATFEKAGVPVVCVPALSRDVAVGTLKSHGDRLRAFQLWLYETLASSEYQRRGWI
jgi:uncharacterized SAM-binding protein YcdF (DUF218 family)